MPETNIYAPPTSATSAEPIVRNKTTYLEYDGYSERGMLLCNEYFKTTPNCLKSGELLDSPDPAIDQVVSRYLPKFNESPALLKAWIVRILLICSAPLFSLKLSGMLSFLTIFYAAHLILNYISSQKVVIKVHLSENYIKFRKRIFILLFSTIATSLGVYIYQINYFESKQHLFLSVAALLLSIRFTIYYSSMLKLERKKGEYYYLRGAHPHFLATLPLRSLDQ